jgi:SAM-dependent methyltransferase
MDWSHGENSRLPGREAALSLSGAMSIDATHEQRQASYDIAEAIAPTWERRRTEVEEISAPVRKWLLRELAPEEGDTVLELAAGVGDTGFDAAEIVGERGRLITSDFSPAMLAAARRRGEERGVEGVEYRVMDAERIELAADSVDGVLCRFGYMLMTDPAAALAETRRRPARFLPGRPEADDRAPPCRRLRRRANRRGTGAVLAARRR